MGTLRVLSRQGDDRYSWDTASLKHGDPEAAAAVREAERIFREARERGATAYRVAPDKTITRIDEFDPAVESIVVVPRVVGG